MVNPRSLPSSRRPASRSRRRPAIVLVAAALACVLALPGLAPSSVRADTPVLADTYNPGTTHPEFRKVLVVGITRNAPARRRFEDLFVSILRGRESQGKTSYSIVPDLDNIPDPNKVVETLFADQVDSVITVRLVSLDDRSEAQWGAAWRAEVGQSVRIRPYIVASLQQLAPDADQHGVEFALWDVQSGVRLWAGRSGPVKVKKLRKSATDLVQDVMNELRHQMLL